ncbi:hypothetical protein O6P43_022892 [Quillaja saponaria]|uniref:Uncharacterized protein n=1 Tax=Quillaja saponaria TaxID=32244 RepID=A0AAD7LFK1_QUISA|nr:hypothetical protein O6P43_022892 [Quillaja saponaria]
MQTKQRIQRKSNKTQIRNQDFTQILEPGQDLRQRKRKRRGPKECELDYIWRRNPCMEAKIKKKGRGKIAARVLN